MRARRPAGGTLSHVAMRAGRGTLAVSMAGQGRLVVFLHGAVCDRRMWWAQLGSLSGRYQVVAYDRRGYGESSPAGPAHPHVKDLDAILEALDADSAILVASGDACRIAIDHAGAHPGRVDGLVLVSPVTGGLPPETSPQGALQRLVDEMELARRAGDMAWLTRLMTRAMLDGPAQTEGRVGGNTRVLFQDMVAMALRRSSGLPDMAAPDRFRRLPRLSHPAAFVCGGFDFPHAIARARDMAALGGRLSHFSLMKGVAQMPGLEAPARFNALLKRLIRSMQDKPPEGQM